MGAGSILAHRAFDKATKTRILIAPTVATEDNIVPIACRHWVKLWPNLLFLFLFLYCPQAEVTESQIF
jgi:hypothetical protein